MGNSETARSRSTAVLAYAVLIISMMQQHSSIIAPAISSIRQYYGGYPQALVNLVPASPFLGMIPSMLLSGWLATFLRDKTIILCGLCIIIVAGLASVFVEPLPLYIILRILIGVGIGATSPFQSSLIPKFFTGNVIATIFGLQSVAVNLFGSIFSFLSGQLARINWRYCSLLYGISVIALVSVALLLPRGEFPQKELNQAEKFKVQPRLVRIMVFMYFATLTQFTVIANLSYFVAEAQCGGPAEAGACLSLLGLSASVAGILYGFFYKIGKQFIFPAGVLFAAIGNFLISLSAGLGVVRVGIAFIGVAMTCLMPTSLKQAGNMYNMRQSALATSFILCTMNLAQFTLPYVTDLLIWVTPGGNYRKSFLEYGTLCIIMFVYVIVTSKRFPLVAMD